MIRNILQLKGIKADLFCLTGTIWVQQNGSTISNCGRKQVPCKELQTGVRNAKVKVIIMGEIFVPTSAVVNRNLSIEGVNKATITSPIRGSFTFLMGRKGIVLKLCHITFKDIRIIRMKNDGELHLSHSLATDCTHTLFDIKNCTNITIFIFHSSFSNIKFVIRNVFNANINNQGSMLIMIEKCFFNHTNGISFKNVHNVTVLINGSIFKNSVCSVLDIHGRRDLEVGQVKIHNTSFENIGTQECLAGVSIYIGDMEHVSITKSNFNQCRAKYGGAVFIEYVKTASVAQCKFVNNSAVKNTGSIYFLKVYN